MGKAHFCYTPYSSNAHVAHDMTQKVKHTSSGKKWPFLLSVTKAPWKHTPEGIAHTFRIFQSFVVPSYSKKFSHRRPTTRNLRSTNQLRLTIPKITTSNGDRACSVSAPTVWNSSFTCPSYKVIFKTLLKTHLFNISYDWLSVCYFVPLFFANTYVHLYYSMCSYLFISYVICNVLLLSLSVFFFNFFFCASEYI